LKCEPGTAVLIWRDSGISSGDPGLIFMRVCKKGTYQVPELDWTESMKITIYTSTEYQFPIKDHPLIKSITEDPRGRGAKSNQRIVKLEHLQSMKSDFNKSDASNTELFHIYAATLPLLVLNWECGIPGLAHRFSRVVRLLHTIHA
jgi:hypothetical protein